MQSVKLEIGLVYKVNHIDDTCFFKVIKKEKGHFICNDILYTSGYTGTNGWKYLNVYPPEIKPELIGTIKEFKEKYPELLL